MALVCWLAGVSAAAAAQSTDWQSQVREMVAARKLEAALERVEQRLGEAPNDGEARGWRARLLAWTNRWEEAAAEYRVVLAAHPHDGDAILGLADVLAWQGRPAESLQLVDGTPWPAERRAEVEMRRGRWLKTLGRRDEARVAFEAALRASPGSDAARAELRGLEPEPRHELRFTADFDHFPFTDDAQSLTTRLGSQWNERWATGFAGNFQRRFQQRSGGFRGDATVRLTQRDALTVGGAALRDAGVIPKGEAFFEYGRGLPGRREGFLRGAELGYRQHWFWYREARIVALTPHALLYLPRDWRWSVAVTVARSRFPGTAAEWRPSGSTRLHFPIARNLGGHVFFGVGTENFAQADQVGRFSARSYGGGLRWQISRRHELSGYSFYQDRSQNRWEIGFGFSYSVRF